MKDINFVTNISPLTSINSNAAIPNWVDKGYPLYYGPGRLVGKSWFMDIYQASRERFFEHFMECVKTRNWEYHAIENLVPIDWRMKTNGIGIESRKPY